MDQPCLCRGGSVGGLSAPGAAAGSCISCCTSAASPAGTSCCPRWAPARAPCQALVVVCSKRAHALQGRAISPKRLTSSFCQQSCCRWRLACVRSYDISNLSMTAAAGAGSWPLTAAWPVQGLAPRPGSRRRMWAGAPRSARLPSAHGGKQLWQVGLILANPSWPGSLMALLV